MFLATRDTTDSTSWRRFASPVVAAFVVVVLVLTGFAGVGRLGAAPIRHVEVATLAAAPTEKPCERGLRAGLCQILVSEFWTDAGSAYDRASEPVAIPPVPVEAARTDEWLTSPPFRPPRATA